MGNRESAVLWLDETNNEQFNQILLNRNIRSLYQPIVSLRDASIFGYEALTRGPAGSMFESPLQLFGFAEIKGDLYKLDRMAREKAIEGSPVRQSRQMLFINISSHIIYDPQFAPGKTMELLQQHGLNPHNVVFEITERSSLEDFASARQILQHYRRQGYKIAIDDAGAGYSSLQAIAELQPDFIKIDRSLISGMHKDKIKSCILETLLTFARKMDIRLVAEGIESMEELVLLTKMGVHLAQGFLLGYPAPAEVQITDEVREQIMAWESKFNADDSGTIANLAVPVPLFEAWTTITEVANYFKYHPEAVGAVIVSDMRPVGLIMRERLFQQLAGQYGYSLFSHRCIDQIMDRQPLIVDGNTPVENVSQMSTSRPDGNLYDLVIITSGERLDGVATVRSILESLTQIRMETAKDANPLSGLPGNRKIHRELEYRASKGKPFSVIYADLDNFKRFNDRYGFQKGDEIIRYTAEVLELSLCIEGEKEDFLGHVGGDDFVAISAAEHPRALCEEIIRRFHQGLTAKEQELSLSLSLSLVICECNHPVSLEQISSAAASLKKLAKAQQGSVCYFACLGQTIDCSPLLVGTQG